MSHERSAHADRPRSAGGAATTPDLDMLDVRVWQGDAVAPKPDGARVLVHPGEVVLVLGPSGCGKSTLVNAACGLIPHTLPARIEGSVHVTGLATTDYAVAGLSTRVGTVFQDPDAQIVTATVLDEVCFGPENLLRPAADVLAAAESALRRVGLWERRYDAPSALSGGGRQRLAIACAIAMGGRLLVLDEPTANLDPAGAEEVFATLRELVADGTRSALLIEHNLDACADLVDRVIVLDAAGRPALEGTVDEVLRERADDLERLGVWLPASALAARRLRSAGVPLSPLPLTPAELTNALDAVPALPTLPATPHGPDARDRSVSRDTAAMSAAARVEAPDRAVEVRNLRVRRGGREVLHIDRLDVPAGDVLAVVGVNGSGKTTLLTALAGVSRNGVGRRGRLARFGARADREAPRLRVAGIDPAAASPHVLARRVGFVFQNPEHQFMHGRVDDELAHGFVRRGLRGAELDRAVTALLERLDLVAHRDSHPFHLSGGQKRRLSVGTVLASGAQVMCLDEPTFGQDRARAAELVALLERERDAGTTILLATHDLQLVTEFARHTAVLADGTLVGHGPTAELFAGDVIERAGLRPPPLARAMRRLRHHPEWRGITRLVDLPDGARDDAGAETAANRIPSTRGRT